MKTSDKIKLLLTEDQVEILVDALERAMDNQDPSEVGYGQDWRDKMNDLVNYIDKAASDVLGL
jgi:hypothetical protein